MSNFLLHSAKARYQRGSGRTIYSGMSDGKGLCRPPCAWRWRGGFSAMTVRQIAREAQVAAGQLHHHFASIGELKSQVFIRLIREMLDMPLVAEDASWRERLFSMIGSEDGRLEPLYPPVAGRPGTGRQRPDIKAAYLLTMTMACRDRGDR